MDPRVLRSWWAERQALPLGATGSAPHQILERVGWARSVGSANPYFTLRSRSGASRADADAAMLQGAIQELPSARGCTYVVPHTDYTLALALAKNTFSGGDLRIANKLFNFTEQDLDQLCERVLQVVREEPVDPSEIKRQLGDAVRNFGEEGKKRGLTTSLPIALGKLQVKGEIRRVPANGRFDQQRFGYVRWNRPGASVGSASDIRLAIAERYFRWIGPASLAHFRWFTGFGATDAKACIQELGLVPVEPDSSLLLFPEDRESLRNHTVPTEPSYSFISAIDSFLLLRRDLSDLLDAEDQNLLVPVDGALRSLGGLADFPNHAILDRGRLVGLWEFDVEASELVWHSFGPKTAELQDAARSTESFIRSELGDARSFSLDSPASRRKVLEAIRAMESGR